MLQLYFLYSVIPEDSTVGSNLVERPVLVSLTTQFSFLFFWKIKVGF